MRRPDPSTGPVSRRRYEPRFVSDETLAPYDRHVRRELSSWSLDVERAITRAPEDQVERTALFSRAYQEAALVAAYLDRPDEARLVLHAGLDFIARTADSAGDPTLLTLGTGPLFELARLDARLGRADEALFVLERISGLLRGLGLSFGALSISAETWAALTDGAESGPIASAVVIETLRALLCAGRYEAVLEASRANAGVEPMLEAIRREAHLVALSKLGRGEEALNVAALWAAEDHPIRRAIFELRHAETLAAFGDPIRAHAIAEECARRVEKNLGAGPATLFDVTLAARIAKLQASLGDVLAAELCRIALPAATALGDAPLAADLALRILDLDNRAEERAAALDTLRATVMGSGYRIPAAERAIEREDGPLVPRTLKERAPSYPSLFSRLLGFPPEAA